MQGHLLVQKFDPIIDMIVDLVKDQAKDLLADLMILLMVDLVDLIVSTASVQCVLGEGRVPSISL